MSEFLGNRCKHGFEPSVCPRVACVSPGFDIISSLEEIVPLQPRDKAVITLGVGIFGVRNAFVAHTS